MKLPKLGFVILAAANALAAEPGATGSKPAFVFNDVSYFHRWSQNDQHEFTPDKQEDLARWSDMITVNGYPNVHDGDALADTANRVLENYKASKAMVLKTDSVPRTPDRPAEHLIAVLFPRPEFIEAAFARLKMVDGIGCSVVYSHRFYGKKVGDEMSAWLKESGPAVEKALMEWKAAPSPASLARDQKRTKT